MRKQCQKNQTIANASSFDVLPANASFAFAFAYVEMGDLDLIGDARNGKQNSRKKKMRSSASRAETKSNEGQRRGTKGKVVTKRSHRGFGHNFCPRMQRNSDFTVASSVRRSLFLIVRLLFPLIQHKSDGVRARAMLT